MGLLNLIIMLDSLSIEGLPLFSGNVHTVRKSLDEFVASDAWRLRLISRGQCL